MKKKIVSILAITLLLTGCGEVPQLSNGEDAVVSFENGDMISIDELYQNMKDTYALTSVITLIDNYVLEKEFPDYIEKSKEYANSYIESIKTYYDSEEDFERALSQNMGVRTIEAYKEYVYLNYMQTHAAEEYAKTLVTDKEIEKYYNDEIVGDIEVSHILITTGVKDDMTDEEKTEAENKAKKEAEDIIAILKETKKEELADKFAELAKKHSKDDATKEKGGNLGKINKDTLGEKYKELVDAAYKLKDGEYSKEVITTEIGYHVIYKTKSHDKKSLEDKKEDILKKLGKDKLDEDKTLATKALQSYRKKYGMEINDDELQKQYANYIQSQLAQNLTNNEE